MSKHTQGRVFKVNPFKQNTVIEILEGKPSWAYPVICTTNGNSIAEYIDNAELIARALTCHDELLEALNSILELGRKDTTNPKYDAYYNTAKAAIAKAEGKEVIEQ